jgi:hypothetical protein
MGFRWLADRDGFPLVGGPFHSIFEQRDEAAQKTEIHSTIGAVDLKDLPDPQGIELLRHWYDNNEQKTER